MKIEAKKKKKTVFPHPYVWVFFFFGRLSREGFVFHFFPPFLSIFKKKNAPLKLQGKIHRGGGLFLFQKKEKMAGVAVDMGDQLSAQPLTHRTTDTSAGDTSLQWVDASQTRSCADETRSPLPSSGLGAEAEKQEYEAEHPVDVRQRLLRSVISLRATLESAYVYCFVSFLSFGLIVEKPRNGCSTALEVPSMWPPTTHDGYISIIF